QSSMGPFDTEIPRGTIAKRTPDPSRSVSCLQEHAPVKYLPPEEHALILDTNFIEQALLRKFRTSFKQPRRPAVLVLKSAYHSVEYVAIGIPCGGQRRLP